MNGRRAFQPRHEFRFGTREVVIFGAALLLILALTFAFGVLVGRELGPAPGAAGKVATGAADDPPPGREAPKAERPRVEERLTFYRTLTAPTPELPAVGPPVVEERMVPRDAPAKAARKTEPTRTAPAASPPRVAAAPGAVEPDALPVTGELAESSRWTVQVSSFRSRNLAERLRTRLAERGFDAYLVSVSTDAGRVRHRVRVGGFPTRDEAERVARELRAERHPNAFVTSRSE